MMEEVTETEIPHTLTISFPNEDAVELEVLTSDSLDDIRKKLQDAKGVSPEYMDFVDSKGEKIPDGCIGLAQEFTCVIKLDGGKRTRREKEQCCKDVACCVAFNVALNAVINALCCLC
eukprot:TRINITY_DN10180_c0_g1_i1.p2 TRINITY_DN10180_c0_g1~~TRINITY_DN10180_c0_g1_i1.p2  ORF type:complete len:118 (-),score=28.03 TRINITY_DN10180_c0_g1_i1:97-450(-)